VTYLRLASNTPSQPRRPGRPHHPRAGPWAVNRASTLLFSEVWAIVTGHLGLVGAWRLMLVCRAARGGSEGVSGYASERGSSCAGGKQGVVGE
jgi:hypothetical protein